MNILAWVLQAILGLYYLLYSVVILIPPEPMRATFSGIPFWLRAVVAVLAALGAAGLVLPGIMRSLTRIVLPASIALMTIAGGELLYRLVRHEALPATVRGVLLVMLVVVAVLRWRIVPLARPATALLSSRA
jgi:hypothetical protein